MPGAEVLPLSLHRHKEPVWAAGLEPSSAMGTAEQVNNHA